ncbi:MAG: formylmethanofuran--tetrahydromethanopterin N-formyltransferase [Alphaproteobacteria bacterium GM202ARS2]|nr:formylmethanofuran--tetrahydromethanopterin N-formyltransferase [Alphaproteobacteria bacterium GM202ARS2]
MNNNGVHIEDTFAEAFPMKVARLVITADTPAWAQHAAVAMTGFATSVIACGCEAGIEGTIDKKETIDGRPGISVLLFAMSDSQLAKHVKNRCSQCVMTSPTSALFSGFSNQHDKAKKVPLGSQLRYFGDGWQISKVIDGVRYWRIPVMEGEFLCADHTWQRPGIGGGNFLILARSRAQALHAAEKATQAAQGTGVIMPFPGGVVRSGSKVGSKYPALIASTNDAFCPTLKGQVKTALPNDVASVLEIVINGIDEESIRSAMQRGINAVCQLGKQNGIIAISAGNYGGKLGPHHFPLRKIMA